MSKGFDERLIALLKRDVRFFSKWICCQKKSPIVSGTILKRWRKVVKVFFFLGLYRCDGGRVWLYVFDLRGRERGV